MTPAEPAKAVRVPAYYSEASWRRWARVYDRLIKLFFLPLGGEKRNRQGFVDFVQPQPGEQILDVCCGTGTLTSLMAPRVGASGRIIGVDLSAAMMAVAREKAAALPVTFERASSDDLPFADSTFDKSFVSIGLHELPPTVRRHSLREVYRILKPGGSFFALDYNLPDSVLPRFVIGSFVAVFEEAWVRQLMADGSLAAEISQADFIIRERRLPLRGMFQMIRADKPGRGERDG